MDYFTPLTVDTSMEYSVDIERFPVINDPSHYSEPALMIEPRCYLPCDLALPEETRPSAAVSISGNEHAELIDLIDTYDMGNTLNDTVDFGFEDLSTPSEQNLLETMGIFMESLFTSDLESSLDLSMFNLDAEDSGLGLETDVGDSFSAHAHLHWSWFTGDGQEIRAPEVSHDAVQQVSPDTHS